jgi:hypothetical protein
MFNIIRWASTADDQLWRYWKKGGKELILKISGRLSQACSKCIITPLFVSLTIHT